MKEATTREFFDASWSIYDRVLDHNYMFHQELYQKVQHFLGDRYAANPVALLDLGCGSARHLANALEGCLMSRYVGYDLSEIALVHAKHNLSGIGCPIELHQGDLLEGLRNNREKFDLIFSSFALHHLDFTEKAAFFQLTYERLKEDGLLLLIDVMREEDEELQLYSERYCAWLRAEWKSMQPEELDAICDHIRNNDFPEMASELCKMAIHAGFSECFEISRFPWHRAWCFEKSNLLSH
jgi:cyclopropane fatty-acyl-phospholipid synthase-like methyltransferase